MASLLMMFLMHFFHFHDGGRRVVLGEEGWINPFFAAAATLQWWRGDCKTKERFTTGSFKKSLLSVMFKGSSAAAVFLL